MAHHATDHTQPTGEIPRPVTGWIWKTFFVLVGVTALEFLVTFVMDPSTFRNSILIVLTIFKAFFIVAEFMHLKHETKGLIWSIMVPMALLIWLMVALITEGSAIGEAIYNAFK